MITKNRFFAGILSLIGLFLIFLTFRFINPPPHRVLFIADTHAELDGKDRKLVWSENSFSRIQSLINNEKTRPNVLVWLGDITDFLPGEWDLAGTWIKWVKENAPETKQLAIMGNHDYLYYNYPEIQTQFNSPLVEGYLNSESSSEIAQDVRLGDTSIKVKDVENFKVGKQLILVETPYLDTKNRFSMSSIESIDELTNSIVLKDPVAEAFQVGHAEARQGFTEERGIRQFLKTFEGTEVKATKMVYYVGNVAFVLISMDSFFKFDHLSKLTAGLSEDDFKWLEDQIKRDSARFNVIVLSHQPPSGGKSLGGLHDPTDTVDFNEVTRARLTKIIADYAPLVWIAGHTHPDARTDKVYSKVGATHFLLVPSLGISNEGEAMIVEFREREKVLSFKFWSTDKQEYFRTETVPLKFPFSFDTPVGK